MVRSAGLGTGELRGLCGEAMITVEPDGSHAFALDYDFDWSSPLDARRPEPEADEAGRHVAQYGDAGQQA